MIIRHYGYIGESVSEVKGARNVASATLAVDAARRGVDGGGKALAAALLDRGRSHLLHGDPAAALRDFQEGRGLMPGDAVDRWLGEELAGVLIRGGAAAEAATLVASLRREGSDAQYCDWMDAQIAWASGDHARVATLLDSVDSPFSAGNMSLPLVDVHELRFLNAVALNRAEEALACGIRLMASYGRGAGHGQLLLDLWGDRPSGLLAQLLYEADRGFLRGMAEEFLKYPPRGAEVAAALVALSEQSNVPVLARQASTGAAFGLGTPPRT